jgi:hypothetical protein
MVFRDEVLRDQMNVGHDRRKARGMRNGVSRTAAVVATMLSLVTFAPVEAAESVDELRLGGLVLTKPNDADISIESADISINPETTLAKYRILNRAATPANVTLAFPIPELDFSDSDVSYAIPGSDPLNFVGLSTRIAGKPGAFAFAQSAQLNGKDITAVLKQNKLPLVPIGTFQNQLALLTPEQRDKLAETGIIAQEGNDANGNPIFTPTWTVRTTSSKRTALPPGQPIDIELRYRTSVGTSLDTPLRNPLRNDPSLASQVRRYKTDYCIDDGFYVGLDRIAAATDANVNKMRERRITYALSGRNALGVVKEFRLVVDKGRADRVVSFCLENLKRISATAFEMRAVDFTPDKDLKVLLIGRN